MGRRPLLARPLISRIFVTSTISECFRWEANAGYRTSKHLTYVPELLAAALIVEALGSQSLILGFGARVAAPVMFLHLILEVMPPDRAQEALFKAVLENGKNRAVP
jgi:uncharacterized membrane protein YphA (DoxX/SURF4 family)